MAVESGERWNGWLGLTHCLIYPQSPCEHSGEIHYLTSSITSHRQGKRPAFHADTHPRDRLRGLTQWGRGSRRNVVTHREQKCLGWGMGGFRGGLRRGGSSTYSTEHTQHIAAAHGPHAYASRSAVGSPFPTWARRLYSRPVGGRRKKD